MTKFNKFQLYTYSNNKSLVDEVDSIINILDKINDYDSVKTYIEENYGVFQGRKLIEFPKTVKSLGIISLKDAIECYGLIKDEQFYSKGWRKL